ncbi:MAG: DUF5615 family PIN-like protein [Nitrospirae bacterium]|nr:DUF5615 family PIN-like protein [Nitrospirota bacterium]
MKVKLDENISRHLKPDLARLGHDVTTAEDEGLLSVSDDKIAAAIRLENRMLLTLDLGFADLRRYAPGTHPGVVVFRPHSLGVRSVSRFVESFVREGRLGTLSGCLVIVEPDRIRIRRAGAEGGSGRSGDEEPA